MLWWIHKGSLHVQVRRRKDPTAQQEGYITVLWFPRCCSRHEKAEKADKIIKYCSSIVLSFIFIVLCCYGIHHKVTSTPHHDAPCRMRSHEPWGCHHVIP